MTDAARFLGTPLGQAGSGRVRYAAAMALWQAGRIGPEVLEVYRIASADDRADPLAMLSARGLPAPVLTEADPPLRRLYAAARAFLTGLDHPGAADVRAGLPADPGEARPGPWQDNPVVRRWLDPALAEAAGNAAALAEAIGAAARHLHWISYDLYPRGEIGEAFATGHAYASILGERAPFFARDVDLGLFLIAPGVLYRDHRHAAPELYAPLTGPHRWRFAPGRPLMSKPALVPVWNPAQQPHLTLVGDVPFLCLFVWTRDVNAPAEVLPADDWAELEGRRQG